MSAQKVKKELHELIELVNDDAVLKAIQTLLRKQVEKDAAAFDSKGKPMSLRGFIKEIEKAESEVKAGKYVTVAQLEKESEKW